ncbi:MAG: hypothetical protein R3Y24_07875 [Eubacteriales bacterium]
MKIVNREKIKTIAKNKRLLIVVISVLLILCVGIICFNVSKTQSNGTVEKEMIKEELQNMSAYLNQVSDEIGNTEEQVQSLVDISPEALLEMEKEVSTMKESLVLGGDFIAQYEDLVKSGEGSEIFTENQLKVIKETYQETVEQVEQIEMYIGLLKSEDTSQEEKEAIITELYTLIPTTANYLWEIEEMISDAMQNALESGIDRSDASYVLLADWKNSISDLLENEMKNLEESIVMIQASLQAQIDATKAQISDAMTAIETLLCDLDSSEIIDYEAMMSQLSGVKQIIDLLQESMWSITEEVGNSITYLDANNPNDAAALALLETLQENTTIYNQNLDQFMEASWDTLEKAIQEYVTKLGGEYAYTAQQLGEVSAYLKGLEDTVGNNQEQLEALFDSTTTDFATINESYSALKETMLSYYNLLESLKDKEESNYEENALELQEIQAGLTDTITSIEDAQTVLSTLLGEINTQLSSNQNILTTNQEALQKAVEEVNENVTETQEAILEALELMSDDDSLNHTELLTTLETMNSDLGLILETNLAEINIRFNSLDASLTTIGETIQSDLDNNMVSINNSFGTLDDSMSTSFTGLNSNIEQKFTEVATSINTNHTDLKEYVVDELNKLGESLNVLFQYVSNGKKNIASALLTKNVVIEEDATFEEIKNAILSIPQELLIGVQELPGTISYDYHYHVDGNGNELHTESNSVKGGCYTQPTYHVHTGSSVSGGGCYTVPIYHTHTAECYSEGSHTDSCASHTEYHTYDCGTIHDYDGDGHGCDGYIVWDCGGHTYLSCGMENGIIGYSLGCGKSTSTIEGYRTGCGFVDGQIIAAHIVYIQENAMLTNEIVNPISESNESAEVLGVIEVENAQSDGVQISGEMIQTEDEGISEEDQAGDAGIDEEDQTGDLGIEEGEQTSDVGIDEEEQTSDVGMKEEDQTGDAGIEEGEQTVDMGIKEEVQISEVGVNEEDTQAEDTEVNEGDD